MNIFKDTMSEMTYGQIKKWCDGAAEDKTLIPHGYVGDPRGSRYIVTNLKIHGHGSKQRSQFRI